MSTSRVLERLYSLGTSSPDLLPDLYCLLENDDKERYLTSLEGPELARLVDFLDQALDAVPISDDVARRCQHKLQAICSQHMILPSSYNVSGEVARSSEDPVVTGDFSDVWEGTHEGKQVCIKCLRNTKQTRRAVGEVFCKEALIWKRLRHPNIVTFIGITQKPLQFVSEWMPNGTLPEYLDKNPDADRIRLLLDVAEGLTYLHANHTAHADLKGSNILINHSGRACLAGFGFASVVHDLNSASKTEVRGFTARWAAPEVLVNGDNITREADVFAFGMVVIEVFTGKCPFSEFTAALAVSKIISGERPNRPQRPDLSDPIWDMTLSCWLQDPIRRPAMTGVVRILHECYQHKQFTSRILQRLYSLGTSSPDLLSDLYCLLENDDKEQYLTNLQRSELAHLVDFLDQTLHVIPISDDLSGRCQRRLQALCSNRMILPSSYNVSGEVSRASENPVAFGGYSEVWEGTHDGKKVCIKSLNVTERDRRKVEKAFCKEAIIWKRLKHTNIVALIGITWKPLQFVSEWMPNGTLQDYLNEKPGANRIHLLLDVAEGLAFLHANNITHGDLKGSNILINHGGCACLADFGLSSVIRDLNSATVTKMRGCSVRWAAPELLEDMEKKTREADMFAFGMVVVEAFTGKSPFSELSSLMTMLKIVDGERPDRPQHPELSDPIWNTAVSCWHQDPVQRPAMMEVVRTMRECYKLHTASLDIDSHPHLQGVTQKEASVLQDEAERHSV